MWEEGGREGEKREGEGEEGGREIKGDTPN